MTISIPVWYDWEDNVNDYAFQLKRFQFQYGTIESFLFENESNPFHYFNSSMVRLRASWGKFIGRLTDISIPVWYDWEWYPFREEGVPFLISIPVWYDWEYDVITDYLNRHQFQFQYGTIERFC